MNLYAKYGPVPTGEVAVADIDGDGASDLFVGLPEYPGRRGRVAVWLGGADPVGARPTSFLVEPGEPTGSFGRAIANAGDVDGDGLNDVVVGAPSPGPCGAGYPPREFGGRVFLVRGASGRVPGTPDAVLRGDARVGAFGGSFGGSGDVDGDGYSDVIVRADGHQGDPCGPGTPAVLPKPVPPEVYLLRGSRAGLSRDLATTPWRRVVGDHDRDGRADRPSDRQRGHPR